MKSKILVDAIKKVIPYTDEYFSANGCKDCYCVWKPSQEGSEVASDNLKEQYSMQFEVHVFSKKPISQTLKELENSFNESRISFSLSNVEYDETNERIEYTYEVEI